MDAHSRNDSPLRRMLDAEPRRGPLQAGSGPSGIPTPKSGIAGETKSHRLFYVLPNQTGDSGASKSAEKINGGEETKTYITLPPLVRGAHKTEGQTAHCVWASYVYPRTSENRSYVG